MRRILLSLVLTLISTPAWACECVSWEGYVSEFSKSNISVWAVPIDAIVNPENIGKPNGGVTYKLEVLESYNRISQTHINVESSVANGSGNCGIQLTLGAAQFIIADDYGNSNYGVSFCTPLMPYDAVKRYLETGEDSFIPAWLDCHHWRDDEYNQTPILNTELEACAVWKDADHTYRHMGSKESRKYDELWWDKTQATQSKKKTPWWHFKRD